MHRPLRQIVLVAGFLTGLSTTPSVLAEAHEPEWDTAHQQPGELSAGGLSAQLPGINNAVKSVFGPNAIRTSKSRALNIETLSCAQLSAAVSEAVVYERPVQPKILDMGASAAISVLASIASPAFYLLGVPVSIALAESASTKNVQDEVSQLRRAMADRSCFVR